MTIKELARIAGVSRGTVDRVLNNRGGVNSDTAQRIRQIAQSTHYAVSYTHLDVYKRQPLKRICPSVLSSR